MKRITGYILAKNTSIDIRQINLKLGYLDNELVKNYIFLSLCEIYDEKYNMEFQDWPPEVKNYFIEIEYNGFKIWDTSLVNSGSPDIRHDIILSELYYYIDLEIDIKYALAANHTNYYLEVYESLSRSYLPIISIRKEEYNLRAIVRSPYTTSNLNSLNIKYTLISNKGIYNSPLCSNIKSNIPIYQPNFSPYGNTFDQMPDNLLKNYVLEAFPQLNGMDLPTIESVLDDPSGMCQYLNLTISELRKILNVKKLALYFGINEKLAYAFFLTNSDRNYKDILFSSVDLLLDEIKACVNAHIISFYPEFDLGRLRNIVEGIKYNMIIEYLNEPEFRFKYSAVGITAYDVKINIVNAIAEWKGETQGQGSYSIYEHLLLSKLINNNQYEKLTIFDQIELVSENIYLAERCIISYSTWKTTIDIIINRNNMFNLIRNGYVSIPAKFTGREEYILHIETDLKKCFPSDYFKYEISVNNLLPDTKIKTFITNNTTYQFGNEPAAIKLQNNSWNYSGISENEKEKLKKDLEKAEFLYGITSYENRVEWARILWQNKLSSSADIAAISLEAFIKKINIPLISEDEKKQVYNSAVLINYITVSVINDFSTSSSLGGNIVLGSYDFGSSETQGGLPTMKDLFGSVANVVYPESRTILSPSAYFVGLLRFLHNADKGGLIIDELFRRRPDIKYILLNEPNTENQMPYIDLVNEILETAVIKSQFGSNIINEIYKSLQTSWSEKDLAAYPQGLASNSYIKTAYDKLSGEATVRAWSLPFNLWHEEICIYLRHLSVEREGLMKNFTNHGVEFTYFDMMEKDIQICGNEITNLLIYYKSNPEKSPCYVKELAVNSGLTYQELVNLLDSYFVSQSLSIRYSIRSRVDANNHSFEIIGTDNNVSPDFSFYERLVRFERLRRKSGLTVQELDIVLAYLDLNNISTDFIRNLAYILKIWKNSNLELEEILIIFKDFITGKNYPGYTLLFEKLFLSQSNEYKHKNDFELLIKDSSSGYSSTFTYKNISPVISNIPHINISGTDYDFILQKYNINSDSRPQLNEISFIIRIGYVCKLLKITVKEFFFLKSINGTADLCDPGYFLQFKEQIEKIRSYGFKISDLAYILKNEIIGDNSTYISTSEIISHLNEVLTEVKASLSGISDSNAKKERIINTISLNFSSKFSVPEKYISKILNKYIGYGNSNTPAADYFTNSSFTNAGNIAENTHSVHIDLYKRIHKLSLFIAKFKMHLEMIEDIFAILNEFNLLNIFNLQSENGDILKKYINLAEAINHSHNYFPADNTFFTFFRGLNLSKLSDQEDAFLQQILECEKADLDEIIAVPSDSSSYIDRFGHIIACLDIVNKTGIPAKDLKQCSKKAQYINSTDSENLKQILKSKYSTEEWYKIAGNLRNSLRIKQRDRLSEYIISNMNEFDSQSDLYHHYLIDTEMGSTAKTTRIHQAILSVQLFIQRILTGLEPGLSFDAEEKEKLEWFKNYRTWEANRKIQIFPENWLDPELRHDKTQAFREIEEKLLQNDVNETVMDNIYMEYLDKLEEVSNLEIMCVYSENDINSDNRNIHLVGKTKGATQKFFYCSTTGSSWTPWQEITNGIKTDMVKMVFWRNSLYMFWPELFKMNNIEEGTEYAYKEEELAMLQDNTECTAVRMAWSAYKDGKWTKAVFSKDIYIEPSNNGKTKNIVLHSVQDEQYITITPLFNTSENGQPVLFYRGYFLFNGNELNLRYLADNNRTVLKKNDGGLLSSSAYNNIINNKFACNEPNTSFFSLKYFFGSGSNNSQLLNLIAPQNDSNIHRRFNAFYDQMAFIPGDGTADPANIESLFKPFILEDADNNRNFLAVPYKPDSNSLINVLNTSNVENVKYSLVKMYHAYIDEIRKNLNIYGYKKLYSKDFQDNSEKTLSICDKSFGDYYKINLNYIQDLTTESVVFNIDPDFNNDFSLPDPYINYNWELFYHIPILIAGNLSKDLKFEKAREWYHLIFDPTIGGEEAAPKKYWKIKPFRELFGTDGKLISPQTIPEFIEFLDSDRYTAQTDESENDPYNPHLIAKTRPVAYMQYVVVKYLENLLDWADMLFSKDTNEDINQAALLYVLASDILGIRNENQKGELQASKSYNDLTDAQGNLIDVSGLYDTIQSIVTNIAANIKFSSKNVSNHGINITNITYFMIPQNDSMEAFYDQVADRLFKIRNSMSIQGVVRNLSLTASPIDPGVLSAAMAAGADLSAALNTLSAPMPLYRFEYMLQKALDFTNDVKSLGSNLLSVLEKKDAEDMALLRSTHERALLNSMTAIREKAIEEAEENINSLEQTRIITLERHNEYKNREKISSAEQTALDLYDKSLIFRHISAGRETVGAIDGAMPQIKIGPDAGIEFGGLQLSNVHRALSTSMNHVSDILQSEARKIDTRASYDRRYEDWQFQAAQAEGELKQIDSQLAGAHIRLLMAEKELENHEKQMENQLEEFEFMKTKFTNSQMYSWMKGQVTRLYQQAYQMAHKLALSAEKAYVFEKQKEGYSSFIGNAYWDNLKEGLMSGELLYNDLRRLEMEYIETNERDIELVKDIPLSLVSPQALISLRNTGICNFEIPEMIYDIDHPGHYMRRIKSVSISIPAVTGPYSGVTCKLSLTSNRFRKSTETGSGYKYQGMDDPRFVHDIIGQNSISTSSGNNDSGMFEFNFRDERYLPFEGAGAIGQWKIELPNAIRKFNYETISDVILHVKYTAHDAGGLFKGKAEGNIKTEIDSLIGMILNNVNVLAVPLSMKTDFPEEFYELAANRQCSLKVRSKHFPYMITDFVERHSEKNIIIKNVEIVSENENVSASYNANGQLTDDKFNINLTSGAGFSEKDDVTLIIKYRVNP